MAKRKIPKTVAGVKIPKKLRKRGFVSALLTHPTGRMVLAEALVAAAGAAAAALSRPADKPGETDTDREGAPRQTIAGAAARAAAGGLGTVMSDVVRAVASETGDRIKERKRKKTKAKRRTDKDADGGQWTPRPDLYSRH